MEIFAVADLVIEKLATVNVTAVQGDVYGLELVLLRDAVQMPLQRTSHCRAFLQDTALADLLGVTPESVYDNRLYRGLDKLLSHKNELEKHLKSRLGTLFDIEFDLLLYDVTSTYFGGQCDANPLAKHGHSRDHRGDCKQVCIGLVVSKDGIPLGYASVASPVRRSIRKFYSNASV